MKLVYIKSLIIIIILFCLIDKNSFGESPSFVNQQINDKETDAEINPSNPSDIHDYCNQILSFYKLLPDIFSTSYVSDGKILDATLWLTNSHNNTLSSVIGEELDENYTITNAVLLYEMMIDIISTYDKGLDYSISIEFDKKTGKWLEKIKQWSPPSNNYKILKVFPYSFPFINDKEVREYNYLNLTLDLEQIDSPRDYTILFRSYSLIETNNSTHALDCSSHDVIDKVTIPPPQFEINLEPSSLTLQPGQKGEVNIKLNSITNLNSVIYLPKHTNYHSNLDVEFIPSSISLPPNGKGTTTMLVTAEGKTTLNKIIPLELYANFPQNRTMPTLNATEVSNNTGILLRTFPQIIVVEPPGIAEQFEEIFQNSGRWLQNFAAYITTIVTIATASLALIGFLSKKKESNNNLKTLNNSEDNRHNKEVEKESRNSLGNIFKNKK